MTCTFDAYGRAISPSDPDAIPLRTGGWRGNYQDAALHAVYALPLVGGVVGAGMIGSALFQSLTPSPRGASVAAAKGITALPIQHKVPWVSGGGGGNSFVAGTGVVTGTNPDGSLQTTSIDQLQVGDVVLAGQELDPSAPAQYALVTAVSHRTVYELTYVDDQGNVEVIKTTDNHEFYTPAPGMGWTTAAELQEGDRLTLADGRTATVTSPPLAAPEGVEVYNLSVSDGKTYFVDDGTVSVTAAWVHNSRIRVSIKPKAWNKYEQRIRAGYSNLANSGRVFSYRVNGVVYKGVADSIVKIKNRIVAIEAKHIRNWNNSIYNPNSKVGPKAFAADARQKVLDQARTYSKQFQQTIYHSNSKEFIKHCENAFASQGITNIKFIFTP